MRFIFLIHHEPYFGPSDSWFCLGRFQKSIHLHNDARELSESRRFEVPDLRCRVAASRGDPAIIGLVEMYPKKSRQSRIQGIFKTFLLSIIYLFERRPV